MNKARLHILWMLSAVIVVFTARPAAAYTVQWNNQWTWYSNANDGVPPAKANPPWTKMPLDYTPMCMNNTQTGLGVYAPTKANWNGKVLYWFDGGGACYDAKSCAAPVPLSTLVADLGAGKYPLAPFVFRDHFATPDFGTYVDTAVGFNINGLFQPKPVLGSGIFDHSSPGAPAAVNPFKNYVTVFVPYCTGDFHVGFRNDTSANGGRTKSNISFNGWANAVNAVATSNAAINAGNTGKAITLSVVGGGSAGGYGALLLYGTIRSLLPTTEKMITISDAGTPYYSGSSSNGVTWNVQGYLTFPPGPAAPPADQTVQGPKTPSHVSYMEGYMADAWGPNWSNLYPSTLKVTPVGTTLPFYPIQSVVNYNYTHAKTDTSFRGFGDRFYVIDGNNDYVDPIFFNMNLAPTSPTIASAQTQLIGVFGAGNLLTQISNGVADAQSGAIPWSEHHGFLGDDLLTWDGSGPLFNPGSGVKQFLSTIAL